MHPAELDVAISQATDSTVSGFLDVARTAAGLGYGRIWMGETSKVDPLLFMARLSAELPGQRLGLGPLPSPLRTGPQLAMAAATLAGLGLPEPIELLLGASSPTMTEGWHGRGVATLAGIEALVAVARQAAGGQRTAIEHPAARSQGFVNGLGPVELRLGLAALGPNMLRLAGRVADRAALNMCTVAQIPDMVSLVAEGAAAGGRPCPPVTVWIHCCVDPDEQARAWGQRFLSGYLRAPGYRDVIAGQGFAAVVAAAAEAANARVIRGLIPDEMLVSVLGFGSAAEVRTRVESFATLGVSAAVVPSMVIDPGGRRTLSAIAG